MGERKWEREKGREKMGERKWEREKGREKMGERENGGEFAKRKKKKKKKKKVSSSNGCLETLGGEQEKTSRWRLNPHQGGPGLGTDLGGALQIERAAGRGAGAEG